MKFETIKKILMVGKNMRGLRLCRLVHDNPGINARGVEVKSDGILRVEHVSEIVSSVNRRLVESGYYLKCEHDKYIPGVERATLDRWYIYQKDGRKRAE